MRLSKNPQEEFTKEAFAETNRVRKALTTAFIQEGDSFSLVRYIGLINGTQQFLAEVTAALYNLTDEQYASLQQESIKLFAKYAGFSEDRVRVYKSKE